MPRISPRRRPTPAVSTSWSPCPGVQGGPYSPELTAPRAQSRDQFFRALRRWAGQVLLASRSLNRCPSLSLRRAWDFWARCSGDVPTSRPVGMTPRTRNSSSLITTSSRRCPRNRCRSAGCIVASRPCTVAIQARMSPFSRLADPASLVLWSISARRAARTVRRFLSPLVSSANWSIVIRPLR